MFAIGGETGSATLESNGLVWSLYMRSHHLAPFGSVSGRGLSHSKPAKGPPGFWLVIATGLAFLATFGVVLYKLPL